MSFKIDPISDDDDLLWTDLTTTNNHSNTMSSESSSKPTTADMQNSRKRPIPDYKFGVDDDTDPMLSRATWGGPRGPAAMVPVYGDPLMAANYWTNPPPFFPPQPHHHLQQQQQQQLRPQPAKTPPMLTQDAPQSYHTLTTPTVALAQAQGSSLMYSPESPEELAATRRATLVPVPVYQPMCYRPPYMVPYMAQAPPPQQSSSQHQNQNQKSVTDNWVPPKKRRSKPMKMESKPEEVEEEVKEENPYNSLYAARARQCLNAAMSREEARLAYRTFDAEPTTAGAMVIEEVDGRLPAVGDRSKYLLTVDEMKRRTGGPEFMNLSRIYGFFRKSKKRESLIDMKKVLSDNDVIVPRMQRARKLNTFSTLLEEECLQLSADLENIFKKFFPIVAIGHQMLLNILAKNNITLEQCKEKLKKTEKMIECILKTLQSRQPAVKSLEEKVKGNALDIHYHVFSLLTHGFGHPNSLTYYKYYRLIIQEAIKICDAMLNAKNVPFMAKVMSGEKPFQLVSYSEMRTMIRAGYQYQVIPQNNQQEAQENKENQPPQRMDWPQEHHQLFEHITGRAYP